MVLLLVLSNLLFAEIFDGPANIRHSPKGRLKLELNDSIFVYTTGPEDGWFNIMATAFLKTEDIRHWGTKPHSCSKNNQSTLN